MTRPPGFGWGAYGCLSVTSSAIHFAGFNGNPFALEAKADEMERRAAE